ncbi:hypothetical protein C8R45DRAFT_928864 [Mycena sanguinolenta]|nr:hypothetical protein C8R45DRAFT_928864 [Mycena sanguinolenta]
MSREGSKSTLYVDEMDEFVATPMLEVCSVFLLAGLAIGVWMTVLDEITTVLGNLSGRTYDANVTPIPPMPTFPGALRRAGSTHHVGSTTMACVEGGGYRNGSLEAVFVDMGPGVHALKVPQSRPSTSSIPSPVQRLSKRRIASSRPIFPSSSIVIVTLSVPRFPSSMSTQRPHTVLTSALRVAVPAAGGAARSLGDAVALGGGFCGDAFTSVGGRRKGGKDSEEMSEAGATKGRRCRASWEGTARCRGVSRTLYEHDEAHAPPIFFRCAPPSTRSVESQRPFPPHTSPCVKLNLCAAGHRRFVLIATKPPVQYRVAQRGDHGAVLLAVTRAADTRLRTNGVTPARRGEGEPGCGWKMEGAAGHLLKTNSGFRINNKPNADADAVKLLHHGASRLIGVDSAFRLALLLVLGAERRRGLSLPQRL